MGFGGRGRGQSVGARERESSRQTLVFVVVAIAAAAAGYAVTFVAGERVNLDGSHSSLAPAGHQQVAFDLALYGVGTVIVVAAYIGLLALVGRRQPGRRARWLLLGAPVLIQLALLPQRPWLSTDVLSYAAQGAVGILTGNAYLAAPRDVLGTDLGNQLQALGWRPQAIVSPYGPLWTAYEVGVMAVARQLDVAILLLKVPALLGSLGTGFVIWRVLGRVRPQEQLLGTVAFLWSPVVVAELAGEGHVDGLTVFLVVLGIAATLEVRPMASGVASTLAVITKYLPVVLVPGQLVYFWRTSAADAARRRRTLLLTGLVAAAIGAVAFAPFWAGLRTLDGLRIMGQAGPWPTVTGIVYRYVERWWPGIDAGAVSTILVSGGFAVFVLRSALGVRDTATLLRTLAATALAFVLVASPVFYPWYAVLPIALVALVPEPAFLILAVVLTAVSRLIAPLVDLRPAYDPIPSAAYTATLVGLCVCIGVGVFFVLRATWAWAAEGDRGGPEESAAAAG